MWTVEIKDKQVQDEAIVVAVDYTQGEEVITRSFAANTQAGIDQKIAKYKKALENRDADVSKVVVGAWTEPVVVQPEPTADELTAQAWVEQWEKYTKAKAGMDALAEAGITPTAEETAGFEALKTWVADNRKPEYTYLIQN